MTQQAMVVLAVALAAAVPGLVALRLFKKKSGHERTQHDVQAMLLRQMQEQIDAQQQTIRFLHSRVDELEKSRAREFAETETLRQEIEDWRQEVGKLRQEVGELRRGVTILTGQLQAADITPAWSPPTTETQRPSPKRSSVPAVDAVALRQRILERFNLDEINDLAFQMGIDSDELSGGTKRDRARALINYVKDRDRLHELDELVRTQWPEGES